MGRKIGLERYETWLQKETVKLIRPTEAYKAIMPMALLLSLKIWKSVRL